MARSVPSAVTTSNQKAESLPHSLAKGRTLVRYVTKSTGGCLHAPVVAGGDAGTAEYRGDTLFLTPHLREGNRQITCGGSDAGAS